MEIEFLIMYLKIKRDIIKHKLKKKMNREMLFDEKMTQIRENSSDNILRVGVGIDDETSLDEVERFLRLFEEGPVYSMPLPIISVSHPEPYRRNIDPELDGTPRQIAIDTIIEVFDSFSDLRVRLENLINNGYEIFVYSFGKSPVLYDPNTFEETRKWYVRFNFIEKSRWYNINPPLDIDNKNSDIIINKSRMKFKHKFE